MATGHTSCCCDGKLVFHPIARGVYQNLIGLSYLRDCNEGNVYGHIFGRRLGGAAQFPPRVVGSVHISKPGSQEKTGYGGLSIARLLTESIHGQSFP